MTEQLDILDTKHIQLQSLDSFASSLGYFRNGFCFQVDNTYYSAFPENKHIRNISFATMCALHNHGLLAWRYSEQEAIFNFDMYKRIKANACKIVQTVKLQYNKKLKHIIVQNHMVEFVRPEYEDLFLVGENV